MCSILSRWKEKGLNRLTGNPANRSRRFVPRRREEEEWLDLPGPSLEETIGNLQDMQLVNRFFGGRRLVLLHLRRMLSLLPAEKKLTLLDVGTGSADIPRAVVEWARQAERSIEIIAIDRNDHVLSFAHQETASYPEIRLVKGDVLHLPFAEKSFDIVLASLICHHLSPSHLAQLFYTLNQLSRYGFLVNDLQRGYFPYAVTWLFTRVVTRNSLTRNDGPLSILRAYTMEELQTIAASVGIEGLQFSRHPFFRLVVVKEKKENPEA